MQTPRSQLEQSSEKDGCWRDIDWKQVRLHVYKLQKRIYSFSKGGQIKQLRIAQNTLINSYNAKLYAVRRVTQDNTGKVTAGIDGKKKLTPIQRFELANSLRIPTKASALRRIWIPKPGSVEKRPLGIPTIKDRAAQALLKLALEPEWEAKFEPNSYGFRPGRNCHDAIKQILMGIEKKSKYVLDADIAKCFDRIDHEALLNKIKMKGRCRKQIQAWLKSGVLDANLFAETEMGTPQGGVISPLLANIALHGLENRLKDYVEHEAILYTNRGSKMGKRDKRQSLNVVRYADDFVVMHYDRNVILKCRQVLREWLLEMGLELSEAKTRITHTLELTDEDVTEFGVRVPGFDFLGFTIRQFKSKYRSAKDAQSRSLGFKTLVVPAKQKCKAHLKKLGTIVKQHRNRAQQQLIQSLNKVVAGWARYFGCSDAVTCNILQKMDHMLYLKLRRWAKRKHKNVAQVRQYWRTHNTNNWAFMTKDGVRLRLHSEYSKSIHKYVKVTGDQSPYDGKSTYWATRMGTNPSLPTRVAKLLKQQKGKCEICKLPFSEYEQKEIDHIVPLAMGGPDRYDNLRLLCRQCHDLKTRADMDLFFYKINNSEVQLDSEIS